MAKKFLNNYDDLLNDMKANNITFSDYDLELAKKNPDSGRSLYTQKLAYGQATTDEERQKANNAANLIRQQYGGYSGGGDGSGFTLSQTYAPPASDYVSQYQDKINDWTNKLTNRDPYNSQHQSQIDDLLAQVTGRGPYQSQYQGGIDSLLAQIMNREDFSYNPAADASYQAYSEKYRNAGNQAMQNALGSAAAMSGGQLSSYALTAAQQAQNNYAAQMSDMIPQLQQLAYEMYQNEGADMRQNLSTLMSQDELAYGRYQDEGDRMYQNLSALIGEDDRAYGRYMDQIGIDQSILSALMEQDNTAYNRHQNSQNDELNRWQMNYGVNRDMLSDQRYEDEKKLEQERYDQSLALDQEDRDYNRALDKAQTLGAAGSFDAFKELGYSDAEIQSLANAYAQQSKKSSGSLILDKPKNSDAYDSVLKKATNLLNDGSMEDAESYLNNMVDNEYITMDEAVYIYDVVLGGSPVMEELVPTSYEEFVAKTGNSGIMSASDFGRARDSSAGRVAGYKDYQDYLRAMYEKYK